MQSLRLSLICGPRQRVDLGESAAHAWHSFVEDALLADELGYDSFMAGEHHFTFASGNSSPYLLLAEVAARTEQIRIGTSVACLPFHNPLRVAEDIAALDIVSKGRFDFGVGVGSQWEEFNTFGINPKEKFGRTWEAIDLIDRCLHGGEETFSHEGKYFNFPDIRWIIPPVQDRVPFFWGGFGPQGVTRAAERDFELLSWDFSGAYERTLATHNRRIEDHLVGFVHQVSIGRTRKDAWEAVGPASTWMNNVYATRRGLDGVLPDPEEVSITVDDLYDDLHSGQQPKSLFPPIFGTVDEVTEQFLAQVRGQTPLGFANNICIEAHTPGMERDDVRRTITLFAKEIMPVLRDEARKVRAERSQRYATEAQPVSL